MSDMVERVARVLSPFDFNERHGPNCQDCEDAREDARMMARRAIEAMGGPTEATRAQNDALRVVVEGLNETLDAYWNGDRSDLMVKLITGWQARAKQVLATSNVPSPDSQ